MIYDLIYWSNTPPFVSEGRMLIPSHVSYAWLSKNGEDVEFPYPEKTLERMHDHENPAAPEWNNN